MRNATKVSLVSAAGLAWWLAGEVPVFAQPEHSEGRAEAIAQTLAAVETVELADALASEPGAAIAKPAKSTAALENAAEVAELPEALEELATLGELARDSEAAPPAAEVGLVDPTAVTELAPTETVPLSNFATESRDLEELATLDDLEDFDNLAQGPAVNTLTDVQPGDWAFRALQDLNARYNCLQGDPDGTFRGERPLSCYDFAAGLNSPGYVSTIVPTCPSGNC